MSGIVDEDKAGKMFSSTTSVLHYIDANIDETIPKTTQIIYAIGTKLNLKSPVTYLIHRYVFLKLWKTS